MRREVHFNFSAKLGKISNTAILIGPVSSLG
jgi:hypothetical protein